jgi:hypothetical protein
MGVRKGNAHLRDRLQQCLDRRYSEIVTLASRLEAVLFYGSACMI